MSELLEYPEILPVHKAVTEADPHIPRARVAEADALAQRIQEILKNRGLEPIFSDWLLTWDRGLTWLFGVLDVQKMGKLEAYTTDDLLHHLSTAIGGRPVYLSNSSGLRYAILLTPPPRLPKQVDFPGFQRGTVALGIKYTGDMLALPWERLGHLLVAGKTGSGKSAFLRLLTYQALQEGFELFLSDIDRATFPMLKRHPALLAPIAHTPEEALAVVERAVAACDSRAALYQQIPGYPENLDEYNAQALHYDQEPLPRILVILDEFNATVTAVGGAKGALANAAAELGWRGRKFGITLVFAAQDFSKGVVGRVRDQVGAVFGFRVRSNEVAHAIGIPDAVKIPENRPGMAVTDRWGPLQTFWLDKRWLVELAGTAEPVAATPLTDPERALICWALESRGGYLTLTEIQNRLGMGPASAQRLAEDWEHQGWLRKDSGTIPVWKVTPILQNLAVPTPTELDGANW